MRTDPTHPHRFPRVHLVNDFFTRHLLSENQVAASDEQDTVRVCVGIKAVLRVFPKCQI